MFPHPVVQYSYILNSVRFRTDSNSVRKTNFKNFYKIFRTELDSVRKQKNIFKPITFLSFIVVYKTLAFF